MERDLCYFAYGLQKDFPNWHGLAGRLGDPIGRFRTAEPHDLVRRLIDGQLTYALADMAALPRAAVVVEDRYSSVFKLEHTKPGFVTELVAALTVRYLAVPIHFAETRPLAEEWTYWFLGAALAHYQAAGS